MKSLKSLYLGFLRRVLKTQVGKIHYLRLDVDIDKVDEVLKDFDLDVKELTYDDFLKGDPAIFKDEKLELIKRRLQDPSYRAYGIIENGRLIYSTWISLDILGLSITPKQPIKLLPNEGLLEDSYCDPIARGRGLHGKMNWYRIRKLHEIGKTQILVLVLDGNTPAMKVQTKCGFKEIGTFHCGHILGRNYLTLAKSKFDQK